MQQPGFERARGRLGVSDHAAVVGADNALHADTTGATVHFDVHHLDDDRLAAEGIGHPATADHIPRGQGSWRRARRAAELLDGSLQARDRTRPLEAGVIAAATFEQRQPECHRVGLGGRRELVDEVF